MSQNECLSPGIGVILDFVAGCAWQVQCIVRVSSKYGRSNASMCELQQNDCAKQYGGLPFMILVYRYYHLLPDLMFKRFCELLWRILNPSSQSDVSQDNIRTGWPLNAHEYPEGYGVAAPPGFCRKRCNCCLSANIGLGVIKASTIPNISFYSLPTGMPQFRLPRTIGFFNHEISRHICHGFALSSIYIVAKSFKQTSLGTGKHTIQVGFPFQMNQDCANLHSHIRQLRRTFWNVGFVLELRGCLPWRYP